MCDVVYRDVPGFPGYRVGSDGTVWSQWVQSRWRQRRNTWRRLKTPPDNHGYPQVGLRSDAGKRHFKVHVLLCWVFYGPRPDGLVTRHLNDDRADNRVSNLSYGTYLENAADTIAHGRTNRGERCHASKLTAAQVLEIRHRAAGGELLKQMAGEYGVSYATMSEIARGRTRGHIGGPQPEKNYCKGRRASR